MNYKKAARRGQRPGHAAGSLPAHPRRWARRSPQATLAWCRPHLVSQTGFIWCSFFKHKKICSKRADPSFFFFFFFLQLSTLQCHKMLLLLFSCLWLFCRSDGEQEQTHTYAFLTGLLCLGLKFVHVFGHHAHGTCSAAAQKSSVPLGGLRSIPAGHDAVRAGHALPPRAGLQLCLQLALCTYSSCIIQCCLYCIPLMFFILFSVG